MRFALLLLAPTVALGAERPLDLEGAVRLALKQNPTLAASTAELDIAKGVTFSTHGLDDLVLDGKLTLARTRNELLPNVPVQEPRTDDFAWSVGLTQPIPIGGSFGLHFSSDLLQTTFATQTGGAQVLSSQRSATPSLQLSFTQPLLRGFGVDVARAPRHRAEAQESVATAQREAAAAELVRAVVTAYWNVELATIEVQVQRASAQAARDQLEMVKANMQVGKQPPTAGAEIEVSISQRDDEALQADQARVERLVELARLLGISPAEATSLSLAPTEGPLPEVPVLSDALQDAGAHAPQLLAARAQVGVAAVDVDVTRNGLLPQLDLALSGGPAASAPNVSSALSELSGLHNYVVQGGLTFSEPIPLRGPRGLRDAAEAGLHKARVTEADVLAQVESAIVRLESAAQHAKQRLDALAPAERAARIDLEAERARFEVGRATNFDVLRRQSEVADAQLRVAQARVDFLSANAAIGALTGELLARHGVVLR